MSIRFRLTLWYSALLCAGLVLFAVAVVWQNERSARASLDAELRHRGADLVADLQLGSIIEFKPDAGEAGSVTPGQTSLLVRVLDPQGRVLISQGPVLNGMPATLLDEQAPGFHDGTVAGDTHVRLYVLPVFHAGKRVATLQLFTTADQLEAAIAQLRGAVTIIGIVLVLIAALGGLFLADRALRPVDRVTRVAQDIGAGDLHRRVSDIAGAGYEPGNDELGRLITTFDSMLARLEEASERRKQFTADAAHALCTPIATLISGAEITLSRPRSTEDYQQALAHVLDEGRYMGQVVDDLLTLARVDAYETAAEHELVELDEVVRQTVTAILPLADASKIRVSTALPPEAILVLGDELRLTQMVRNLLDNALRYTPADGTVTVSLHCAQPSGQAHDAPPVIFLRVTDSGPGIPEAERERIFERFHRAAATAAAREPAGRPWRSGGSGLGLAICKATVESHGGRIWVESGGEGGASFVVALPALAQDDNAALDL